MPPLVSIDRPKVPIFPVAVPVLIQKLPSAIAIPNFDSFVAQLFRTCTASDQPKQFFDHTPPKYPLGSEQRKRPISQRKSHLSTKLGACPSASTISFVVSALNDFPD
mmetsp:Transcript_29964/g.41825  ORF Transcript_29964/g.41825 Transcript_29964/m.41825 type:complete len:107 (-) Transcript_29964:272-592(-)